MNPQLLIDQIIQAKLGQLQHPQAAALRDQLEEGYLQIMVEHLLKELQDNQVNQLSQLISADPDPQQIQDFIQEHVADFNTFNQQVMQSFRSLHLSQEAP